MNHRFVWCIEEQRLLIDIIFKQKSEKDLQKKERKKLTGNTEKERERERTRESRNTNKEHTAFGYVWYKGAFNSLPSVVGCVLCFLCVCRSKFSFAFHLKQPRKCWELFFLSFHFTHWLTPNSIFHNFLFIILVLLIFFLSLLIANPIQRLLILIIKSLGGFFLLFIH